MNDKLYFVADINNSGFELAEYVPLTTQNTEVINNPGQIRLFPNPSTGNITVEKSDGLFTSTLTIYTVTGNKVFTREIITGISNIALDLKPGIYIYRIDSGLSVNSGKLIIR